MEVRAGYKQTEVGSIPEEWNSRPLTGLVTISHGFGFQSQYFKSHGKYFLTTPGHFFEAGGFRNVGDKQKFYDGPLSDEYILSEGDLILAMTEQTDGLLGSAALVPLNGTYLHNQRLGKIKVLSPELSIGFLYHVFNSSGYRTKVRETAAGTKVKHTSPSKLLEIPVPLPPTRVEQKAIASALSDADALIESLEQLLTKKRHLKQGAMQELLTGNRRLPGFTGEWEAKPLSDMGSCYRGVSYNPAADLSFFDNAKTVRLLRSNNVQDAKIVFSEMQYVTSGRVSSEQRLREKDILICMANGSRDLVGKAGQFHPVDGFDYTFGAFMGCFRPNGVNADLDFVFYLFQTEHYRSHIGILLAGSSINNLTPGSVEAFSISVPVDMQEQSAIATILSDMDAELAALEAKLENARHLKQGMMQVLLTGQVRLV